MNKGIPLVAALALVSGGWAPLEAQEEPLAPWLAPDLPMSPQFDRGQPVSPIFEGWYVNPDGSYTLSFGYFNRNLEETIDIPLGPDNFIEPAEYDGGQPTHFPALPDYSISGREWGTFAVVVPSDFVGEGKDVVWTLRNKGGTFSVPGRVGVPEWQLQAVDQSMGEGSLPPRLRLDPEGPEVVGHEGVMSDVHRTTSVGEPITLTVWAADNFVPAMRDAVPVGLTWWMHQGPPNGTVSFDAENEREGRAVAYVDGAGAEGTATATFSEPGEYVLRVRADNWRSGDSDDQRTCCWTNGYVGVTVTR